MTDSFQVASTTVSFWVLSDGRSRKADSQVSERQIAASDTVYVDLGGKKARRLSLSLEISSGSDVLALEGLVNQQGTLTYHEGTFTAVLASTDAGDWFPGEHQVVKAEFVVVSAAATPDTAPVADFVYGVSGLDVEIDVNQGSSTVDNLVDQVNVEWGDGATTTQTAGAPYDLTAYEIPLLTHTYADVGSYQINVSIARSGTTSADCSQIVTLAGA